MANLSYGVSGSSYYDLARQGQVFAAYAAAITTPVVYSTAAGTGGPLLWNGTGTANTPQVYAVLLGVSITLTTAETTAAVSLGLTGNSGQTSAPTSTTGITAVQSTLVGGQLPACTAYNVGTVTNAGNFFLPLSNLGTGALTTLTDSPAYIDLAGSIVVPPGSWISLACSGTSTAAVLNTALLWAEVVRR